MATLQNKTVVIIGGSSGIGFGMALAALQSLASVVIIASSNRGRVNDAIERLKAHKLPSEVRGEVLNAKDSAAVKQFALGLGAVDHIAWTSGDLGAVPGSIFTDLDSVKGRQSAFAVRFLGPFILAQHAKFNSGGSLTLTLGCVDAKPRPVGSVTSALTGLVRGLMVDLAPVRVNVVSPGAIDTELVDKMLGDKKDLMMKALSQKILLKRAGEPSEIAEAYTFLMKCGYITGQRIDIEGGASLV